MANPGTLIKIDQKSPLLAVVLKPKPVVLFATEELDSQSHAIEHVRLRAILCSRNRIPLAKAVSYLASALRTVICNDKAKLKRILAVVANRVNCCLGTYPIHDGDRNGASCSHTPKSLPAWKHNLMRTRNIGKRVKCKDLPSLFVVLQSISFIKAP